MNRSFTLFASFIFVTATVFLLAGPGRSNGQDPSSPEVEPMTENKIIRTEEEWKEILSPEQFYVTRQAGTEQPFTGEYYDSKDTGTYYCAGCGDKLFRSDAKFDSDCGWPSFFEPESKNSIVQKTDHSHGMIRTEIVCGGCGGHLGHVFNDGPPPTGLRYCINSASLIFKKEDKNTK